MRKFLLAVMLLVSLAVPVSAVEISAPEVPEFAAARMPADTSSFPDALTELFRKALGQVRPDLQEAGGISSVVVCAGMLLSVLQGFSGSAKRWVQGAGGLLVASVLLSGTNSLVRLAAGTVQELGDYGKLLLPVMTAAMAAQGGAVTSTALYTGTAFFDMILSSLISKLMIPAVYLFLALSVASAAGEEALLKKLREMIRGFIGWSLKAILTVFTTYMSITGAVSGTTDAVALKATKMTISTVVPVVGGILSDASETVLVSAALVKNTAGVYGILAILAVFLTPFLTIGVHYLLMKLTAALCGILGSGRLTDMTEAFSTAMGLLLAMTGSVCVLQLVSTICFLKGIR